MAEYYVQQNSPEERARIARFISRALTATFAGALVFAAFILAARWWAPMIPFSAEKRFADRYVGFFVDRMEPGDPVLMDYVTDLAKDLSEQMKMPAEFEVVVHYVDDPEPVAFATLGGHVFVFKGILESLETENALAMVLAHELAHLANRDAIISTGRAVLFSILLFSATGRDNWSTRTADTATELALLRYGREQERIADQIALGVLQARYGTVSGATTFFEQVLESMSVAEADSEIDRLLSTHPRLQERIDELREQAVKSGWGDGAETPYPPPVKDAL